ncbi:gluconate 2-dehydrogenase subunit 3 family protein [Parapedobacter tibetensis]|uniref:gluconate 2-dehydrogenase subunit 3 family protein n=1 Tax=Parapedobacter tibetensis TaxID=2972951 RepID=UPI00214D3A70|nr:gluconate 2-dehydrogenase subunit 3 family protein [Parapedobacter tibetensis]
MNRRDSIKALGLAAAGSGLLLGSCGSEKTEEQAVSTSEDKLPGVQDFEHQRNQRLYGDQFFTSHEMATISVLADIIIPADDVSGSATEAGVPEFIEFMAKDVPDYQIPMRGGLKWLDVQSQRRYGHVFIGCDDKQQRQLIDDIAYPSKARPEMQQGVAFFTLMRNLTASGFFTSEMGVKDIGYVGNRPGVWEGVPPDVLEVHGFLEERG